MNQDFLIYLQRVLKEHNLESSLDELAVVCSRYGIEKQEQLEPDTISGIYHTVLANRQKDNDSHVSVAARMKKIFNKKVEEEAQTIVQDYQNVPVEIQEAVIKTMMAEYVKKNPKIEEFLAEADYAKIAEENIQHSQKMLKILLVGLLVIIGLLLATSFLDSFVRFLIITDTQKGVVENVNKEY